MQTSPLQTWFDFTTQRFWFLEYPQFLRGLGFKDKSIEDMVFLAKKDK